MYFQNEFMVAGCEATHTTAVTIGGTTKFATADAVAYKTLILDGTYIDQYLQIGANNDQGIEVTSRVADPRYQHCV